MPAPDPEGAKIAWGDVRPGHRQTGEGPVLRALRHLSAQDRCAM